MKRMTNDELIKMVCQLKEEILSLRVNEIFMKKVTDQMKAVRNSMNSCSFSYFYSKYKRGFENSWEQPQKLLKIVEELAESVSREVTNCFQSDVKNSMLKEDFSN